MSISKHKKYLHAKKLITGGWKIKDACKIAKISKETFYRWKRKERFKRECLKELFFSMLFIIIIGSILFGIALYC